MTNKQETPSGPGFVWAVVVSLAIFIGLAFSCVHSIGDKEPEVVIVSEPYE